jgi:hypothetical protein
MGEIIHVNFNDPEGDPIKKRQGLTHAERTVLVKKVNEIDEVVSRYVIHQERLKKNKEEINKWPIEKVRQKVLASTKDDWSMRESFYRALIDRLIEEDRI